MKVQLIVVLISGVLTLIFLTTREEAAMCLHCGYLKVKVADVDENGKRIRTENGYKLLTTEIAEPYGMLRIKTTDGVWHDVTVKSKDELHEMYTVVAESRSIISSARIHRFDCGKRKVIDVLELVRNAN